jgi:hypothetical protein
VASATEHAELLRQLDTMHLLQDSNKLMRDEQEHKDKAIEELKAKVLF